MALLSDVSQILDQVFSLCRIQFVTDFLFTSDPVADIAILTSPVQTEHSIAARISISGTESSTQFAHIFDFSSDFYFASVPAFSVGPVTVGFCTQEPTSDTPLNDIPLGYQHVLCSRYVRDDDKGVFLMISENPVTGITEVDCMSHKSARQRMRVCARFNTDIFKQNLTTPNGVLHPEDVAKSLSYLSIAYERRKCPICAASDDGECGCILPFRRPSHPLDFRNERRNMSLHTGVYQGGSTVRLFNALQPFIVTNLSTKSVIKGSVDRNIILRMNKLAVQLSMSKLSVNPLAMMMPGVTSLPLSNQQDVSGLLQGFFPPPEPSIWGGMFTSETSEGAVTMNSGIVGGSNRESPSKPLSLMGDGSRDYLKEFVDANTNGKKEDKITGVTPSSKTIQKSSESESAGKSVDDKDLKAELRRQRNREAAAKSNIKRKVRNEALRRDLADAKRRVNELRMIEKTLREENVKLRSMANKNKVKITSHLTHIQISNS